MHITGLCMHVLHALPHDVTGQCMQLLRGLCCFDFILDIPLPPATLNTDTLPQLLKSMYQCLQRFEEA